MPAGRPTEYKQEYCDMLVDHMSDGLSFYSFAAVVDVSDTTLENWAKQYPEFLGAKKIGRTKQLFYYEKLGAQAAAGRVENFNSGAFVWMTKNMLKWREPKDDLAPEDTEATDKEDGDLLAKAISER